jgi:hypothetical protein
MSEGSGGNSGVMQFALGLSVGGFMTRLKEAEHEALGMATRLTAGLVGAEAMFESMAKGFERGVGLEHLSKRTGESVGNLYELQRGFQNAGLSADSVGEALFHMQRALGGISEEGEATQATFARLGLKIEDLRKAGGAESMKSIIESLAKLNDTERASAASTIFGRGGAQAIVQLSRSTEEFSEGMKSAMDQAARLEKYAPQFEKAERAFGALKENWSNMFLNVAGGAAPGIEKFANALNKIDFAGVGEKFGNVLEVMAQSIEEHDLGHMLELQLKAGLEAAGNYMAASIAGIENAMTAAHQHAIEGLQGKNQNGGITGTFKTIGYGAMGAGAALLGAGSQLQQWIDPSDANAKRLKSRADAVDYWIGKINGSTDGKGLGAGLMAGDMTEAFQSAFKDSLKSGSHDALDEWNKYMQGKMFVGPPWNPEGKGGEGGSNTMLSPGEKVKDGSAWEKFGFVFNGSGGGLGVELQRTIAENTRRTAELIEMLVKNDSEPKPKLLNLHY